MKVSHLALAFAAIMLSTAPTFAQNSGKNSGASDYSLGHQMQNDTGSSARGASEYSPGHQCKTIRTRQRALGHPNIARAIRPRI